MTAPVELTEVERSIEIVREKQGESTSRLVHEQVTGRVLAAFFAVYRELGYGFLPAVYVRALVAEFSVRGVPVQIDVPLCVFYKGQKVGAFTAELLVEGRVVVGVTSGPLVNDEDRAQLLNYMRGSRADVGMLLHFGPKPEFRRFLGRTVVEARPPQVT